MSSSSSSGTDVPSELLLTENSHLIQVYSNTLTTWRGVEWYSFTLDVKIHKTLREGENHDEVNHVGEEDRGDHRDGPGGGG